MYQIQKLDRSPEWPTAIGRAIMAFGDIESAATNLIGACTEPTAAKKAARLPLDERLKCLDALLHQEGVPVGDLAQWASAYEEVQDLRAKYRNKLAHGSPGDVVVVTDETITQTIEHKTARKPADRLTLDEVKEVGERTERARLKMVETAGKVLVWLFQQNRGPLALPPISKGPTCIKCGAEVVADDGLPS